VQSLLRTGTKPSSRTVKVISVPAEIYDWKASAGSRVRAKEVQDNNRQGFLKAFSKELAVLGYERDAEGNGTFLLGRWNEKWAYTAES